MKRSEILKLAKTELWDGVQNPTALKRFWRHTQEKLGLRHPSGSSEFICLAIDRACKVNMRKLGGKAETFRAMYDAQRFVMDELDGAYTFVAFIRNRTGTEWPKGEVTQGLRLQWLDGLIEKLIKEGN